MIMQHQRELALTDEQKTFMRGEIQRTTTRFNELQWQLQDQMEALHETVKSNSINEQLALSQLDKVLESERDIKRLHMELAIRLKNKLTADQQMKLQTIRQNNRPPRGDGPGMGPGRGPGPGRPGGPGLVRDKDRDLPEVVRADSTVLANRIAFQCPSVRHPKRHG